MVHAFSNILTIGGPNTRKHSESGERDPTSRSEDRENFFLVSPIVRMLRLRDVSEDWRNQRSLGAELKDFPRREYGP